MAMHLQIQNLPVNAGIMDIKEFFAGTDLDMRRTKIRVVGGVDGDAFVTFQTEEELLTAVGLVGKYLLGQPLNLFLVSQAEMDLVIDRMFSDIAKSSLHDVHDDESSKLSLFVQPEVDKKLKAAPWMKQAEDDEAPSVKRQRSADSQEKEKETNRKQYIEREIRGEIDHGGTKSLKGLKVTVNLCDKDDNSKLRVVKSRERSSSPMPSRRRDRKHTGHRFRSRDRSLSPMPRRRRDRRDTAQSFRSSKWNKYPDNTRSWERKDFDRNWMFREREEKTQRESERPNSRRRQDRGNADGLFTPRERSWSPKDRSVTNRYWMFGAREPSWSPNDRKSSDDGPHVDGLFRPRERSWSSEDRNEDSEESDSSFSSRERSWSPENRRSQDRGVKRQRSTSDQESEEESLSDPGFVVVRNVGITVTARDLREFFDYPIAKQGIIMKSADQELQSLIAYVKFVWLKDAVKCLGAGLLLGSEVQTELISPEEFEKEMKDSRTVTTDVPDTNNTHAKEAITNYPYQHSGGYQSSTPAHTGVIPITQYQTNPYQYTPGYIPSQPVQPATNYPNYPNYLPPPFPNNPYPPARMPTPFIAYPYPPPPVYVRNMPPPRFTHPPLLRMPRTDSEQKLSIRMPPPVPLPPIVYMSRVFTANDSGKKLFYLGLWNIPTGTTACGVWALYGGSNGRSLGVVFGWVPDKFSTGDLRPTAFVAFENERDCDQAKSTYRCCQEYNAEDVDKFFAHIATRDGCQISISTKSRVDRVLSAEESAQLAKPKEINPVILPSERTITGDRPNLSETAPSMITTQLLREVRKYSSSCYNKLKAKGLPNIPQILSSNEASKNLENFLTDPTLDSAWSGNIYLIIFRLPCAETASSIWNMFKGPDGKHMSTGVIITVHHVYQPRSAYIGFKNVEKCTEAMKMFNYLNSPTCTFCDVIKNLSYLLPQNKILVSTCGGKDYLLTALERNILKEIAVIFKEQNTVSKNFRATKAIKPTNVVNVSLSKSSMQNHEAENHTTGELPCRPGSSSEVNETHPQRQHMKVSMPTAAALSTTPVGATSITVATSPVTTSEPLVSLTTPLQVVDNAEQFNPIQQQKSTCIKKIKVNLKQKQD